MKTNLTELKYRLRALTVFADLRNDPVIDSLCAFLFWIDQKGCQTEQIEFYSSFVEAIFKSDSGHLGKHIESICCDCENVYVKQIGSGKTPNDHIVSAAKTELQTLQMVANLTKEDLCDGIEFKAYLPSFPSGEVDIAASFAHRTENIGKYGYGLYAKNRMFYLDEAGSIVPVKNPDSISLSSLVPQYSTLPYPVFSTA